MKTQLPTGQDLAAFGLVIIAIALIFLGAGLAQIVDAPPEHAVDIDHLEAIARQNEWHDITTYLVYE